MDTKFSFWFKALVILLVGITGISVVVSVSQKNQSVGELFSFNVRETAGLDADTRVYQNATAATGTPIYFTAGSTATTTLQFQTDRANQIDLNVAVNASSTATALTICNQFSYNGIDWYSETGVLNNSYTEGVIGSPYCRVFIAPSATTHFLNLTIPTVASKYTRINFGITGADGSLWAQAVLRELYN